MRVKVQFSTVGPPSCTSSHTFKPPTILSRLPDKECCGVQDLIPLSLARGWGSSLVILISRQESRSAPNEPPSYDLLQLLRDKDGGCMVNRCFPGETFFKTTRMPGDSHKLCRIAWVMRVGFTMQ